MGGTFWIILLASLAIVGLAVVGMAIGVMTTGRCLQGSCGGPGAQLPNGDALRCAGCPNRRPPAPR